MKATDIREGECVLIDGLPLIPTKIEAGRETITVSFKNAPARSFRRDEEVVIPGDDFVA